VGKEPAEYFQRIGIMVKVATYSANKWTVIRNFFLASSAYPNEGEKDERSQK
jgi:hypothetical protein